MNSLEGANCADLPAFVIDKYFGAHKPFNRLHINVAKAICGNCVVLQECREGALGLPLDQLRGVRGGNTMTDWKIARSWRQYEQGMRDSPPVDPRPMWLPMTDATHHVEQQRISEDEDEPGAEI